MGSWKNYTVNGKVLFAIYLAGELTGQGGFFTFEDDVADASLSVEIFQQWALGSRIGGIKIGGSLNTAIPFNQFDIFIRV
jgi:hypothetical protein